METADEIQTGFGRTGTLFAMEQHHRRCGVLPDLMTCAKSLAVGLPLAAVTGRAEVMDAVAPGGLGGAYAGNPLAIAAAHAVLEVKRREQLPERGARLGERLREALAQWRTEVPEIGDIRGLGAMVAAELRDPNTGRPLPEYLRRVQTIAQDRGLVLLSCGVDGNVLRFLFPLSIEERLFDEGLEILHGALLEARQ